MLNSKRNCYAVVERDGKDGIGFNLTENGNFDLDGKLIRNIECPDDVKDDESFENIK